MVSVDIQGNVRTEVGKKGSSSDRKNGLIPAVLYGGENVKHFTVTPAAVKTLVYTPDFKLAVINIGGDTHRAILKQVQFHPVTDQIIHIDFLRLIDKTPIKVEIPLRFKGTSPGVKLGGKLIQQVRKVKVKTTPESLVHELYADISGLDLGQSLRVKDIIVPKGIEVVNNASTPVALIEIPRALKAAAAAEAKLDKGKKK
ncbi:MAG: 50S ribosomal protein L25 [Saprospiraceae bacterium]